MAQRQRPRPRDRRGVGPLREPWSVCPSRADIFHSPRSYNTARADSTYEQSAARPADLSLFCCCWSLRSGREAPRWRGRLVDRGRGPGSFPAEPRQDRLGRDPRRPRGSGREIHRPPVGRPARGRLRATTLFVVVWSGAAGRPGCPRSGFPSRGRDAMIAASGPLRARLRGGRPPGLPRTHGRNPTPLKARSVRDRFGKALLLRLPTHADVSGPPAGGLFYLGFGGLARRQTKVPRSRLRLPGRKVHPVTTPLQNVYRRVTRPLGSSADRWVRIKPLRGYPRSPREVARSRCVEASCGDSRPGRRNSLHNKDLRLRIHPFPDSL